LGLQPELMLQASTKQFCPTVLLLCLTLPNSLSSLHSEVVTDLWMAIYSLWDNQATHKCHAYQNSGTSGELVIVSTMPNCCVYGLCTLTPQLSPYQTDDYQTSGVEGIVGW